MRWKPGSMGFGLALVALALTGCSSQAHAISNGHTAGALITWPTRGEARIPPAELRSALATWSHAVGTQLTGGRVLFGADEGVVGLSEGQCQLLVLTAVDKAGEQKAGWFLSPSVDALGSPSYVGQESVTQNAKIITLLASAACGGTGPASPFPTPSSAASTASGSVRLFALAAPGYIVEQSGSAELRVGESPFKGTAVASEATSSTVSVDVYSTSGTYSGSTTTTLAGSTTSG